MTSLGKRIVLGALAGGFVVGAFAGCGSGDDSGTGDDNLGTSGSGGAQGSGASASAGTNGGGATTGSGGVNGVGGLGSGGIGSGGLGTVVLDLCGTEGCQCSNGVDDDNDGTIDGFDEECTGAIDNDEGSFATGIPGDNRDENKQDCFFDGDSGQGNDGCDYNLDCLTGDIPQDDPRCTVSQECIDFCSARVPNGCDCFGCCETSDGAGGRVYVQLAATCTSENIADEEACPRCVQSEQCQDECGECELCLGKTEDDLPDSCQQPPVTPPDAGSGGAPPVVDPPDYTCDGGEQVCSADFPCGVDEYCSLGCCSPIIR